MIFSLSSEIMRELFFKIHHYNVDYESILDLVECISVKTEIDVCPGFFELSRLSFGERIYYISWWLLAARCKRKQQPILKFSESLSTTIVPAGLPCGYVTESLVYGSLKYTQR